MITQNFVYKAILLDDQIEARESAREVFEQNGFELVTVSSIDDFFTSCRKYPIILCDYQLKRFMIGLNAISLVSRLREENPNAIIAIYSAFGNIITEVDRALLVKLDINVYSKNDPINAIRNLKRAYHINNDSKESLKTVFGKEHYELNKQIVLHHIAHVSNKNIQVPIIKLNKLFSLDELEKEVKNDTQIGNFFIIEIMENIALLDQSKEI